MCKKKIIRVLADAVRSYIVLSDVYESAVVSNYISSEMSMGGVGFVPPLFFRGLIITYILINVVQNVLLWGIYSSHLDQEILLL